jgi:hypothetical protein
MHSAFWAERIPAGGRTKIFILTIFDFRSTIFALAKQVLARPEGFGTGNPRLQIISS